MTEESDRPPLTSCSQIDPLTKDRKSGLFIRYETGQFYLLLTNLQIILDESEKMWKRSRDLTNEYQWRKQTAHPRAET